MTLPTVKLADPTALRGYAHPLRLRLVGLLRGEGPMTATRAAEHLGESVASCSFHLRQLAKYGLAERVDGANRRERPWRATAMVTSWDGGPDDPAMQAATDQLNSAILDEYVDRARRYLARRANDPAEWRKVGGFGDAMVYVTAAELAGLVEDMETVLSRFDERITDPATRPPDSRGVSVIQLVIPKTTDGAI
jgi:hypothetical protein